MKGVLPWLAPGSHGLPCRAGTKDFCPALVPLVGLEQNIFSPTYTVSIYFPYNPANRAGSHAGLPVSYYVSLTKASGEKYK
jgi:hypothetical protein